MKIGKIIKWVCLILLAILVYLIGGILIAYCRQPELTKEEMEAIDAAPLFRPQTAPERAGIVEDNLDALKIRVRMIRDAKEEIVLSTFAFHSDQSGTVMIGALLDAAQRGVSVRILVDGFESWTAMEGNKNFYALSSHENVCIRVYNKANPFLPWRSMGRMHDKYLIADGRIYILGGRNTYDYFLGDYPGHKNFDRDVLVTCEAPDENSSVTALSSYFEKIWESPLCSDFHNDPALAKRKSVTEAAAGAGEAYEAFVSEKGDGVYLASYEAITYPTEHIALIFGETGCGVKKPVVWYRLCRLMEASQKRVMIHSPYVICNQTMYDALAQIAKTTGHAELMTNSAANNGNPFGAGDYLRQKDKILETGFTVWEYEGGYSYHGKSILIDDTISVVGSFNLDMRSVYLDTELMLVIDSTEVNRQLQEGMEHYEQKARIANKDGSFSNPYGAEPVELTSGRSWQLRLINTFLGWARFLF